MSKAEQIKKYFNELRADNLDILNGFYSEHAQFVDPVGSHKGLSSIKGYYGNVYKNVQNIEFRFHKILEDGNDCVAVWTMHLTAKGLNKGKPTTLDGTSEFKFDQNGLVEYHRDYFDMNEFIYQYIPVLSFLTKKVNSALSSHS